MSTATWSSTSSNVSASSSYAWMHPISASFGTFGWVQAADTGQVVWPVTIISITNAAGNGTTVTFTYTVLQGAPLRVGGSIKVTNCTTAGFNATYTIASLPLSTTFTALSSTNATEAETAFGSVDVQVAITNAIGNGATNTYTYTNSDGTFINGQSVVITGCTTSGFNGTFTVASINSGAGTFTTTTGISHASEVETGKGIVTSIATNSTATTNNLPLSAGNFVYEVWQMADTLQSTTPVILKVQYSAAATTAAAQFAVTLGRATDGAGNLTGATSGLLVMNDSTTTGANDTVTTPSYASGSTNRYNLCYRPNRAATIPYQTGYLSIERSHNSSGVDTSSYVTIQTLECRTGSAIVINQVSLSASGATQSESKLPALLTHNTTTGSYAGTTLLSPTFPMVGAIGNPMTNTLVGKASDWADLTNFSFTMYNTARNYQVCNVTAFTATAGLLTYDATPTAVLVFRFD